MSDHKIKITLKSDICPGSGYAYSGLIDSDVCFDDYGIPFIPGRRLKGCLKESADMLVVNRLFDGDTIKAIFGETGKERSGSLLVSNAYIDDYDEICDGLKNIYTKIKRLSEKENEQDKEKVKKQQFLSRQRILEQFTSVKAQTKMKEGVAEDDSLRFTRVVNRYSPFKKELTFTADISLDEIYKDDLEKIVKATRNMGMDRNRGLGSVVCELIDVTDNTITAKGDVFKGKWDSFGENDVTINIMIRNTAPLMISGDNDEVSLSYIPAQNVIGCLAGKYLQLPGKEYGIEFENLFLDGTTCYSNLYVSNESDEKEYIPAPSFVNRLKKTGKYVNVLETENKSGLPEDELFKREIHPEFADADKTQSGNMPKKLRGKYIAIEEIDEKGKKRQVVTELSETEMFIDYHHTKKAGKEKNEHNLYTNQVIKEGQFFRGTITTKGKYVPLLKTILETRIFRFGKSKSAQYGSCVLVNAEAKPYEENSISVTAGDIVMVSLVSDGIFMNEPGFTVRYNEVRDMIAEAVGIESTDKDDDKDLFSFVTTGITFGYNTKWNLRKQPVPVIAAGSTFVYKVKESGSLTEISVGERVHEGFGRIKIFQNTGYDMNPYKDDGKGNKPEDKEADGCKACGNESLDARSGDLFRRITGEEILKNLKPVEKRFGANGTQLGRLTLMLKESNKADGFDDDNFRERVDSIKSPGTKLDVMNWLRETNLFEIAGGKLKAINNAKFKENAKVIFDMYKSVTGDGDFEENYIKDNRYYILMEYLTNEKYLKKINEKADAGKEASENE